MLILSKILEKSSIVNLPFHIIKLLDQEFTLLWNVQTQIFKHIGCIAECAVLMANVI